MSADSNEDEPDSRGDFVDDDAQPDEGTCRPGSNPERVANLLVDCWEGAALRGSAATRA